jgi:hypothetical protein
LWIPFYPDTGLWACPQRRTLLCNMVGTGRCTAHAVPLSLCGLLVDVWYVHVRRLLGPQKAKLLDLHARLETVAAGLGDVAQPASPPPTTFADVLRDTLEVARRCAYIAC